MSYGSIFYIGLVGTGNYGNMEDKYEIPEFSRIPATHPRSGPYALHTYTSVCVYMYIHILAHIYIYMYICIMQYTRSSYEGKTAAGTQDAASVASN